MQFKNSLDFYAKEKYDLYNLSYLFNSLSSNIKKEDLIVNGPKGKYAWTATVGEKGQIVIPKQARELFHIKPGDTLILLGDEERGIAIPPKDTFSTYFNHIFGDDANE